MDDDTAFMDSTELKESELLKEVQVDYSPQFSKLVNDTISAIKTSIDKIPNDFKVTADMAPSFVRDIGADKVDFKFKKPTFMKIGGSYSIQSLARPKLNVDLIIRFLQLLANYDWTFSPLVVDINNDLNQSDEKEMYDNFLLRKGQGENGQNVGPVMFLATVYDKTSEAWTRLSPRALELKRLVAYARSSAYLLMKLTFQEEIGPYRWECLFRTPLNNYDAIIILRKDKLPYPQRLLFSSEVDHGTQVAKGHAIKCFQPFLLPKDLKGRPEQLKNKLLVDFDPSRCFIKDLEKEFSSTFQLWHDSLGGDVIGLTWGKSYSSKKRKQEEVVEQGSDPHKVLKAVGEVGKGFVRSIYVLKPPRQTN